MEDVLHKALKYDILSEEDLENLENRIEVQKREDLLNKHPYSIWQGKNGNWYTKLPVNEQLKLIKRKNKADIENIIVDFWSEKLENPTIKELFNQWIEERELYGELRKSSIKKYSNDYKRFIKGTYFEAVHIRNLDEEKLYL